MDRAFVRPKGGKPGRRDCDSPNVHLEQNQLFELCENGKIAFDLETFEKERFELGREMALGQDGR